MKIKTSSYSIEDVDQDGLNYIASNFSGNVRDLEGAWIVYYSMQFNFNQMEDVFVLIPS